MSFKDIADAMDAVNEQHLSARGLDGSHLGRVVARRWGGDRPIPKGGDADAVHVPTVVLRCGHERPYDPEINTPPQKQDVLLCSECGVGQEVVLIPKVREGDQHLPSQNDEVDVQSLVIADIEARRQLGIDRYGTALQPFNGRDWSRDLLDELYDAIIYERGRREMRQSTREKLIEVALSIWNAISDASPSELCAAIVDGILDAVTD